MWLGLTKNMCAKKSPFCPIQALPCPDKAHVMAAANGATGHADPWLGSAAKLYIKHLGKIITWNWTTCSLLLYCLVGTI